MKVVILNPKDSSPINIDKYPDVCPFCHKAIHPKYITGMFHRLSGHPAKLELVFLCPSEQCSQIFISYYIRPHSIYGHEENYYFYSNMLGNLKPISFSDIIKKISEDYCQIFMEAYFTEQWSLKQICGGGYRKSLEFLIKDYLIKIKKKDESIIKAKFLGKCIEEDIENDKIKNVAKRAAWLGNDETHYVRKWEDKDLSNLKDLIKLTVSWIEDETLTEKYRAEMPE